MIGGTQVLAPRTVTYLDLCCTYTLRRVNRTPNSKAISTPRVRYRASKFLGLHENIPWPPKAITRRSSQSLRYISLSHLTSQLRYSFERVQSRQYARLLRWHSRLPYTLPLTIRLLIQGHTLHRTRRFPRTHVRRWWTRGRDRPILRRVDFRRAFWRLIYRWWHVFRGIGY